jgi:hypothetical protein
VAPESPATTSSKNLERTTAGNTIKIGTIDVVVDKEINEGSIIFWTSTKTQLDEDDAMDAIHKAANLKIHPIQNIPCLDGALWVWHILKSANFSAWEQKRRGERKLSKCSMKHILFNLRSNGKLRSLAPTHKVAIVTEIRSPDRLVGLSGGTVDSSAARVGPPGSSKDPAITLQEDLEDTTTTMDHSETLKEKVT